MATAAAELLPPKVGLVAYYAALGCLGGIAAAAQKSSARPSAWTIVQHMIVGAVAGAGTGFFGLAKLGTDDPGVYWTMFLALASGVAPAGIWKLYTRKSGEIGSPP